ncbi:Fe-S cluster assembly protein SufD [Hyphomicrobium sp.]|uniref:Fe-S cluster assembly protein SufD n=1 Tax=Hyphomicrobium sp. TaxID=82 RepID=UPI002E306E4E|nr:Fe-S cluster assembly protein SufD [Hyphomicrobium sp.]HEX2840314.1 Fe-S cluster assembly protein SufD [Hyphomicrobium sp.]
MSQVQAIKPQAAGRPSSVQPLKTKAETALAEAFTQVERQLPGGDWLRQLRRAAAGAFTAEGLPHRRVEEWKFTDLRAFLREAFPIAGDAEPPKSATIEAMVRDALPGAKLSKAFAAFVDGRGVAEAGLGSISELDGAFVSRFLDHPPAWLENEVSEVSGHVGDGVLALNTALFSDGAVLDIANGRSIDTPIALVFGSGDGAAQTVVTRNVVRVGKNAKVVLVECHLEPAAPRQVNTLTQIVLGDGAEVVHIKLVASREGSIHLGRTVAKLGANATYRPFQMVSGNGIVRNDLAITFKGQHSTFDLGSALLVSGHGHTDTTLVVDHAVPHCTSRELVKCVLADTSRGVFQGKVIVRPDAQKTDGKQMAQALMLSPDAEFDSKPELEIYADDVVCGHGSTSAEIDPDLVFYLQSRGIPRDEAHAMLVESFIGEAIDKVEPEDVQEALRGLTRQWLQRETPRKQA